MSVDLRGGLTSARPHRNRKSPPPSRGDDLRLTLTVPEAAFLLGTPPGQLYRRIALKQIPDHCILRLGDRVFIRKTMFVDWLKGHLQGSERVEHSTRTVRHGDAVI